jgi:signal transduction histidine kinase
MLEEADRLAGLVDRLLTLSRAETGQAKLSLESVDLGELAQAVAADLAVLAEEKNQRVVVEPGGSPHVLGDRLMLRQALINLVDNAIKFSPSGAPIVIRVFESAGRAVVEVVDGGPGIPPGIRDHIFDRFYRAPALSDSVDGTGLGLSIAKSAVEANGGTLTLEHSGADGSAFRISVPRSSAS